MKAIVLVPGPVTSCSLLLNKGVFRRLTVDGMTGKALCSETLRKLADLKIGSVETLRTANNSTVSVQAPYNSFIQFIVLLLSVTVYCCL